MSSYESLPSLSSSTPSERTLTIPSEVRRDIVGSSRVVDLTSRLPRHSGYEWVDPRLTEQITQFQDLSRVSMLKPNFPQDVITTDSCRPFEHVCHS